MQDWTSFHWFSNAVWQNITWARPWYLYGLLLLPLLPFLRYIFRVKNKPFLSIATVSGLKNHWSSRLRFLPPLLVLISLCFFIIALAGPQQSLETSDRISEGIDIALALDISESMTNTDFKPNRLEVAKKLLQKFVTSRQDDRLTLISFAGRAATLSPLTTDHETILELLKILKYKDIEVEGTAIGDALALSVAKLRNSESKTKVIILVSDGDNTAGNLDPTLSAQLAKNYNIKLYTILVGLATGTDADYAQSVDKSTLSNIAKIASGQFFQANNAKALEIILNQINNLEKAKFEDSKVSNLIDIYEPYLKWGMVFLLLAFATKITFLGNIMED